MAGATWTLIIAALAFCVDSIAGIVQADASAILLVSLTLLFFVVAVALRSGLPFTLMLSAAIVLAAVQTTFVGYWLPNDVVDLPGRLVLIELKTAMLLAAAALCAVHILFDRRSLASIRGVVAPLLLLAAWACIGVLQQAGPIASVAAYLRNFTTPLLVLVVAGLALRERLSRSHLDGCLTSLSLALTVASILQLSMGTEHWDEHVLHIDALQAVKGPMSTQTDFLGMTLPRLRSLPGEPIGASYTFAALACWALLRRRYWLAAILGAQNFLTFAKGGMLVLAFAVLWALIFSKPRSISAGLAATFSLIATLPMLIVYGMLSGVPSAHQIFIDPAAFATGSNSAFTHAAGLVLGLSSVLDAPLGHGTGAGGNFGNIFASMPEASEWISTGGESAVGVLAYQLGLPAMLLFTAAVARLLNSHSQGQHIDRSATIGIGMTVGWVAASLFQENAFGPQAALPVLAVAAFAIFSDWKEVDGEILGQNHGRGELRRPPRSTLAAYFYDHR